MDFSIEPMDFGDEPDAGSGLALKLATDDWEVNVYAPPDDFLRLRDIRAAAWNDRRAIEVGKSGGTRCFWAAVNDHAALMIGDDDETWDISIAIPFDVIDEIVAQVRRTFSASPTPRVSASTRDTTRGKLAMWSSTRETTPTGSC